MEISNVNVDVINTDNLRKMEGFVTQQTHLFHDSIRSNLRIAKLDATDEELVERAKRLQSTDLSFHYHRDMILLSKNWETAFREANDRELDLPEHFCMMHRCCCWTSQPVIWIV